jgi:hypothetical protein
MKPWGARVLGLAAAPLACTPVPAAMPTVTLASPGQLTPAKTAREPAAEAAPATEREPATDHEMTAEEASENPAVRATVQQLDEWASSVVHITWTSSSHSEEACFDEHDEAIACTGAVHRREKRRKIANQATLTNAGTLPFECWPVAALDTDDRNYERARVAAGVSTTPVRPGQRVVFPKVEPDEGQMMFGQSVVICSIPSAALSQFLGVDLSPVLGRASHSVIVIAGSDSYQFTSSDSGAPGLFEWFEGDVLLK